MENEEQKTGYLFVKNRYYPGKLLHAGDFTREQEYGNAKLQFINRKIHGYGIIEGLEVGIEENSILTVSMGSAIDHRGRLIAVQENVRIDMGKTDDAAGNNFVVGLQYAEQPVGEERDLLGETKSPQVARIAESYILQLYSLKQWEQLRSIDLQKDVLTREAILYEDSEVHLTIQFPVVVPADSIFKIRLQVKAFGKESVNIGWHGTFKLQGAFFMISGQSLLGIEEEQTYISGSAYREWELCTEEYQKKHVALELSRFEILTGDAGPVAVNAFQTYIETATEFEDAVRKCFQGRIVQLPEDDWIPLARLKREKREPEEQFFAITNETGLRPRVVQSEEKQMIRAVSEENGIMDIRWRGLLKAMPGMRPPAPPISPFAPAIAGQPPEREEKEPEIHRGVVRIPVPRFYRKGKTLLSEKISHGFPGYEVWLRIGRVYEETNYAYWEEEKIKHTVIQGTEELFQDIDEADWRIRKYAIRQNVEDGTFQIAIVLSKEPFRKCSREVAVSWTAVRLIRSMKSS